MANNNHGLGQGIEALFGDNHINTGESIAQIPLTKLVPNPYQPRSNFDRPALLNLANSIREDGVFQPIIVRKSLRRVGQYEILAGERRFRASKLAHKRTIPAIVRTATNQQMMEIAVMENLEREDLTPIEEARAYQTLVNNLHLTQAQVAKRMGKSRPYVANYMRLLNLPAPVQRMLQNRQLSSGQARAVMAMPDRRLMVRIAKRACKDSLTVKQINALVRRHRSRTGRRHHMSKKQRALAPFVKAAEDQLQDRFGTQVLIRGSQRHYGKVEIKYRSLEDLNRVLRILKVNLN